MVRIRLAREADVPGIAALMNRAAAESPATFTIHPESDELWLRRFREGRVMYPWLVAVDDAGAVAGFAKAGPHRARDAYAYTVELTIFLPPEWHRRGVGKRLYERLLAILHMQGYYTAVAAVTTPNPASEALHEKMGMRRVGTFHRSGWKFERWHDVTFFEMAIQDDHQSPRDLLPVEAVAGE